jgi:hypothetical protein
LIHDSHFRPWESSAATTLDTGCRDFARYVLGSHLAQSLVQRGVAPRASIRPAYDVSVTGKVIRSLVFAMSGREAGVDLFGVMLVVGVVDHYDRRGAAGGEASTVDSV